MANEQEFTLEEQIEFIKHEIGVKEEYVTLIEDETEESETAQKELGLLNTVLDSLNKFDLLLKIDAENIPPIFEGK